MKKKSLMFLTTIISTLIFTKPVYAAKIKSPISLTNIGQVITRASGVVTPLAVLGFIFAVIYAGYTRMFALGNPDKEAKSMKIAVAAATGFAIIALAPVIVQVLGKLIGVNQDIIT